MTIPQHHPTRLDVTPGDAAVCRCETTGCNACGERVCRVHQADELTECVVTYLGEPEVHHKECAQTCGECAEAAYYDRQSDLADARRKGEW